MQLNSTKLSCTARPLTITYRWGAWFGMCLVFSAFALSATARPCEVLPPDFVQSFLPKTDTNGQPELPNCLPYLTGILPASIPTELRFLSTSRVSKVNQKPSAHLDAIASNERINFIKRSTNELNTTDYTDYDDDDHVTPTGRLYQNRPHFGTDETIIAFDLPQSTTVKLIITDQEGTLLFREAAFRDRGYHEIEIDTRKLAPGRKLYSITTDAFTLTKPLLEIH